MDMKKFFSNFVIVMMIGLGAMYVYNTYIKSPAPAGPAAPVAAAFTSQFSVSTTQPIKPMDAPQLITLGSVDPTQPAKLAVTINTALASVQKVQLNPRDYAATVGGKEPLTLLQADPITLPPFATLAARVNGNVYSMGYVNDKPVVWKVIGVPTATEVELSLILYADVAATEPLVEIRKSFTLRPDQYEMSVRHEIINLTTKPITAEIDQMGPTDMWNLPPDDPRSDSRHFHAGAYKSVNKEIKGDIFHELHATFAKPGAGAKTIGEFQGAERLVWVAAGNRFFTTIVRPLPSTTTPAVDLLENNTPIAQIDHLRSAVIEPLHQDPALTKSVVGLHLNGQKLEVAAGAKANLPLEVFFGPKKRDLLSGTVVPLSAPLAERQTQPAIFNSYRYIDVIMFSQGGPCGFCTFSWLALFILKMLDWIHVISFGNYGVAIIILVLVVRLLLHPLTRYSQIQMAVMSKKMAGVAPELERAKKRYAKDNKAYQEEMMRIYREHKINPAGGVLGCAPMLLQTPIWIALYAGLAVDIDLRHAGFIPGWINDLSNPDTIMHWNPVSIPLLGAVGGLNLLPLLLGVAFFFQMRFQMATQPKSADDQQQQMQKISQWMIMIFPVFLYNAPSGLNLYIFASTAGGLIDTWIVRKSLRKRGLLPNQPALTPVSTSKAG